MGSEKKILEKMKCWYKNDSSPCPQTLPQTLALGFIALSITGTILILLWMPKRQQTIGHGTVKLARVQRTLTIFQFTYTNYISESQRTLTIFQLYELKYRDPN